MLNKSCVESLAGLEIIMNHFDKYPLITKKQADYKLFKLAVNLIKNKSHLTKDGLLELVALKAVINNGINNDLSIAFPNIDTVLRPQVQVPQIINPSKKKIKKYVILFFVQGPATTTGGGGRT